MGLTIQMLFAPASLRRRNSPTKARASSSLWVRQQQPAVITKNVNVCPAFVIQPGHSSGNVTSRPEKHAPSYGEVKTREELQGREIGTEALKLRRTTVPRLDPTTCAQVSCSRQNARVVPFSRIAYFDTFDGPRHPYSLRAIFEHPILTAFQRSCTVNQRTQQQFL